MPTKTNTTWINIIIWCNNAKMSRMIWIGRFATKTKIYNRNVFLDNDFNNKKTVFMAFIDHGQKMINQTKKSAETLIICPARKNSEKRYKKENFTISSLTKNFPENVGQKICFGDVPGRAYNQIWQHVSKRWDVRDINHVPTFRTTHYLYIYTYISLFRK